MSKSILVIDTPESCNECQFSAEKLCENGRCTLNKDCSNLIPKNGKPDWCLLRDLSEKKSPKKFCNVVNGRKVWGFHMSGFNKGFNACIDEILKGANGNDERAV